VPRGRFLLRIHQAQSNEVLRTGRDTEEMLIFMSLMTVTKEQSITRSLDVGIGMIQD
jgi:hypothetical protein